MTEASDAFKDIVPPLLHPPLPAFAMFAPARVLTNRTECAVGTVEEPRNKSWPGSITPWIPKQTHLPISYNIAPSQKILTI
jgi:hypothetical protein